MWAGYFGNSRHLGYATIFYDIWSCSFFGYDKHICFVCSESVRPNNSKKSHSYIHIRLYTGWIRMFETLEDQFWTPRQILSIRPIYEMNQISQSNKWMNAMNHISNSTSHQTILKCRIEANMIIKLPIKIQSGPKIDRIN